MQCGCVVGAVVAMIVRRPLVCRLAGVLPKVVKLRDRAVISTCW